MLYRIPLRLALPVVLAATLLPAAAFAQSQDTQSVAEAARRARAHKKNTEKPAKVITEETLDVKKGDVQSATGEQLRIPGSPETPAWPLCLRRRKVQRRRPSPRLRGGSKIPIITCFFAVSWPRAGAREGLTRFASSILSLASERPESSINPMDSQADELIDAQVFHPTRLQPGDEVGR